MSSAAPIISIVGATGSQGSGLAFSILRDPARQFRARVLVRDPESDKAKEYAKLGAEVVKCDVSSLESLTAAFQGSWGAFIVSLLDFSDPAKETAQIEIAARAAKAADLKYVVFSSFEDSRIAYPVDKPEGDRMPTIHGRYKVGHFDSKAEGKKFFTELGIPTTFVFTSFYWDNFAGGLIPQKAADKDEYSIILPIGQARLCGIAAEDIGKSVFGIFKRSDEFVGKTVGVAGEILPMTEVAAIFSEVYGKQVVYSPVPAAVFRTFPFPGAEDLGNMFQYFDEQEKAFTALRDVNKTRELNPELKTFRQFLEANKSKIPIA